MSHEQSVRVLVADDEHIIADTLALILQCSGFDSRAVYNGEDAAKVALAWQPDAVIAEAAMREMDGVALAIYLEQALPFCRVLLISGNTATEQLINESRKRGYDFPILAKPVHPDKIFEFLSQSGIIGRVSVPVELSCNAGNGIAHNPVVFKASIDG